MNASTGPLYSTVVTAEGSGARTAVRSDDGYLDVRSRRPEEVGGDGGATCPEQLFAGGYAACFHAALFVAAESVEQELEEAVVSAEVELHRSADGVFTFRTALRVRCAGVDEQTQDRLVEEANRICPFSAAARGAHELTVNGRPM